MATMRAYHGDRLVKAKYLKRLRGHIELDQLVKGKYINDAPPDSREFCGCAAGCVVHSNEYMRYEVELGIPVQLAYLHDACFEGLSKTKAQRFAYDFLEVISVGADLSLVIHHYLMWSLIDEELGIIRFASNDRARDVIRDVAALHQRVIEGGMLSGDEWDAVNNVASHVVSCAPVDVVSYAALDAARDVRFEKVAKKLLSLLQSAPVPELAE